MEELKPGRGVWCMVGDDRVGGLVWAGGRRLLDLEGDWPSQLSWGQWNNPQPREDTPQFPEEVLGTYWLVAPWVGLGPIGLVTSQAK